MAIPLGCVIHPPPINRLAYKATEARYPHLHHGLVGSCLPCLTAGRRPLDVGQAPMYPTPTGSFGSGGPYGQYFSINEGSDALSWATGTGTKWKRLPNFWHTASWMVRYEASATGYAWLFVTDSTGVGSVGRGHAWRVNESTAALEYLQGDNVTLGWSWTAVTAGSVVATDTWHHVIAITGDEDVLDNYGLGCFTVFIVDGVIAATTETSFGGAPVSVGNAPQMGRNFAASSDMDLAAFFLWNRALTRNEIYTLIVDPLAPIRPNPMLDDFGEVPFIR